MQLIAYYRVSTQRQGQSGLGLEAQQAKVQELAAAKGADVIAEFTEVESGRKSDRPVLAEAMAEARRTGAAVVVAKLDRLARDAEFVLRLSSEAFDGRASEPQGLSSSPPMPTSLRRHGANSIGSRASMRP